MSETEEEEGMSLLKIFRSTNSADKDEEATLSLIRSHEFGL